MWMSPTEPSTGAPSNSVSPAESWISLNTPGLPASRPEAVASDGFDRLGMMPGAPMFGLNWNRVVLRQSNTGGSTPEGSTRYPPVVCPKPLRSMIFRPGREPTMPM